MTNAGTIIDASFVEVPRQRNTREENDLIKAGQTPPERKKQPHKLSLSAATALSVTLGAVVHC